MYTIYILPFLGPPSPKDLDGPSVGVLKRNQYFKNHEKYMVLTSFHSWDLPNVPAGSPDLFPLGGATSTWWTGFGGDLPRRRKGWCVGGGYPVFLGKEGNLT